MATWALLDMAPPTPLTPWQEEGADPTDLRLVNKWLDGDLTEAEKVYFNDQRQYYTWQKAMTRLAIERLRQAVRDGELPVNRSENLP